MKAANIITLSRILLVPVFIVVYISHIPYYELISLLIFLLASLTDKLDGYVARKYNQITTFGKLIDPLADKLLISAALIVLTEAGIIPSWCSILILSREFIVTSLRAVGSSTGRVIAANNVGKIKMVVQVVVISFLFTSFRHIPLGIFTLGQLLIAVMTFISVYSGVDYCYHNRDIIFASK